MFEVRINKMPVTQNCGWVLMSTTLDKMDAVGFPDSFHAAAWGINDFLNHPLQRKSSVQPFSDVDTLRYNLISFLKGVKGPFNLPNVAVNLKPLSCKFFSRKDKSWK